jgi:hypothetical protein
LRYEFHRSAGACRERFFLEKADRTFGRQQLPRPQDDDHLCLRKEFANGLLKPFAFARMQKGGDTYPAVGGEGERAATVGTAIYKQLERAAVTSRWDRGHARCRYSTE